VYVPSFLDQFVQSLNGGFRVARWRRRAGASSGSCRTRNRQFGRPCLEALEERSLLSVAQGVVRFSGLGSPDSLAFGPPDAIAAAGPNQVVEAINTTLAFYDKSSGDRISEKSLSDFFSSLGNVQQVNDPVVSFDEMTNRFVVGAVDSPTDGFGNRTGFSSFDFAVSNDSNPSDGFTFARFELHDGTAFFPRLGWNADAYVISFNMSPEGSTFDHVDTLSINKNSLAGFVVTVPGGITNQTMVPAVMHGSSPGGPMWLVQASGTDSSGNVLGGSSIRVVEMSNELSNSPNFINDVISVSAYANPPLAVQPGNVAPIRTNDCRILNAAWRNNQLVASQNVGSGGLAHARWYAFNTTGGSAILTQTGEINPGAGVDTYFPSIEIAANGDFGMTFMESSSTENMSMYVTGRQPTDAPNTMQPPVRAQAGQRIYTNTDTMRSRAGAYSGISVDPTAPTGFWAANEFATSASTNNWGTWITGFSLAGSGLAPVNYGQPSTLTNRTSGVSENVFHVGTDGNLYVDHYDPSSGWVWVNEGNPGTSFVSNPVAITIGVGNSALENVYLTGADGDLWIFQYKPTSGWSWIGLPNPGVAFIGDPTAVNYGSGSTAVEDVFLTGADGHLHDLRFTQPSTYTWADLGNAGTALVGRPSGNTIQFSYTFGGRTSQYLEENVYVTGADGNLYWAQSLGGGSWTWTNLAHPVNLPLTHNPAVLDNGGGRSTSDNVFVTGTDGHLYMVSYVSLRASFGSWIWSDLNGPGPGFASDISVSTYSSGGSNPTVEDVFVVGTDGNLYDEHLGSTGWGWQNRQNPGVGIGFVGNPAAITYNPGTTGTISITQENVFVSGNNHNLYYDEYYPSFSFSPTSWRWQTPIASSGPSNFIRTAFATGSQNAASMPSQASKRSLMRSDVLSSRIKTTVLTDPPRPFGDFPPGRRSY
jgi:hypothetical protein